MPEQADAMEKHLISFFFCGNIIWQMKKKQVRTTESAGEEEQDKNTF